MAEYKGKSLQFTTAEFAMGPVPGLGDPMDHCTPSNRNKTPQQGVRKTKK